MICASPVISPDELRRLTGWEAKPEGLCRGEICLPFTTGNDGIELEALAGRLGAGLVHDAEHSIWAMGPAALGQGRFLADSQFPELTLPDLEGQPFSFSSLRGRKVVMIAWASW